MFKVHVKKNGNMVKTETIATMGELKAFLYGIQETIGSVEAYAFDSSNGNAMIVQESATPIRQGFMWTTKNGPLSKYGENSLKFLKKFKKSAYA